MPLREAEPMQIAVIGAGECSAETARLAERVGAGIARRGALLVCGGLGGVMEAAARGAKGAGGTTVGILPGTDPRAANPHIDVVIPSGLGEARNALVVRAARAVVAVDGGYGTLSEIAIALKTGVPVVGLESWAVLEEMIVAADPDDAVERAFRLAEGR
jgi:uncharacterized protein (TIGR00725 family)